MFISSIFLALVKSISETKKLESEVTLFIQNYLQFHIANNTITDPSTQQALKDLLQNILLQGMVKKHVDFSTAISNVLKHCSLSTEEKNKFKRYAANKNNYLEILDDHNKVNNNNNNNNFKEEDDVVVKTIYSMMFFGFSGFETYFSERVLEKNNLNNLIIEINNKIALIDSELQKNNLSDDVVKLLQKNREEMGKIKELLFLYKSIALEKKRVSKFSCEVGKKMHQFDGATSYIFRECKGLSSKIKIQIFELLRKDLESGESGNKRKDKGSNKEQLIFDAIAMACSVGDRDSVSYLIEKYNVNPFKEIDGMSIFLSVHSQMQEYLITCLLEKHKNSDNNNNNENSTIASYVEELRSISSDMQIALMITAMRLKDTQLFKVLTHFKNNWESAGISFDSYSLFPQENIEFEFKPVKFGTNVLTYKNTADFIHTLNQCVILNLPDFIEIIFQSTKKYSFYDIVNAIDFALMYESFDALRILIKHLPTLRPREIKNYSEYVGGGTYEHILLKATAINIELDLFEELIKKLSPEFSITDSTYNYVEELEYLELLVRHTISVTKYIDFFLLACNDLIISDYELVPFVLEKIIELSNKIKKPNLDWDGYYIMQVVGNLLLQQLRPSSFYEQSVSANYEVEKITNFDEVKRSHIPFSILELHKIAEQQEKITKLHNQLNQIACSILALYPENYPLNFGSRDFKISYSKDSVSTATLNKVTLFTIACMNGNVEVIKLMLEHGAIIEPFHLCVAALYGNTQCVKLFIDRNVDYYFYESNEGKMPLDYAVVNNHVECVKLLVDAMLKGKDYVPTAVKHIKRLYACCTLEQVEIRQFLLNRLKEIEKKLKDEKAHSVLIKTSRKNALNNNNNNNCNNSDNNDSDNNNCNNNNNNENIKFSRYERLSFFHPTLKKQAVLFVNNKHAKVMEQGKGGSIKEKLGNQLEYFGERIVEIGNMLKYRDYNDNRFYLLPISNQDLKEKHPEEEFNSNTLYYETVHKAKHDSKKLS